mgnify:CR=1 FL=1
MSLDDLGIVGDYDKTTLLIDGDLVIFSACCVFNEDDDHSRQMIERAIKSKIGMLVNSAGADDYRIFVTTKFNFRDDLVDDYKANRDDVNRPVNLTWAKRWAADHLEAEYVTKLEADDLLGINQTDNTVIWSIDKDLRQIPGKHLDDESKKVITITEEGELIDRGNKTYFTGTLGLYYQMLIGDNTDYIVGCGQRLPHVYKSGAKEGQEYIKRVGIGNKKALKMLDGKTLEQALEVVIGAYKDEFADEWQENLETQANLLFMVRERDGDRIKRWTYDGRDEWFSLEQGVILHG